MNVLHISPSFFPASQYGGTIYSGYALCNALAQIPDLQLRVLTTDSDGPTGDRRIKASDFPTRLPQGYDVYYCRRRFGADISPRMFALLWPMMRWADVVHLTAVYSPPTLPALLMSKLLRKPLIWSPRGGLQRWGGSTRTGVKNWWDKVCNLLCEPGRVQLHVTSEAEKAESLAIMTRASATIIPNGIDFPGLNGNRERAPGSTLNLLFMGRLHPIKGIENLLRALTLIKTPVRLSLCGEGDAEYTRSLKTLARDLSLWERVEFCGRVDGAMKEQQFASADLCVVPSFKENFCMVVAEALARSVPVIASEGTPWQQLTARGCGLWVSNQPEALAQAIDLVGAMPLAEMGQRGRAWMQREYSWQTVAAQMHEAYKLLGAAKPSLRRREAA